MGDVVSLNRTRKRIARTAANAQAVANRVKFGRTGAEKVAAKAEVDRRTSLLDGAHRED